MNKKPQVVTFLLEENLKFTLSAVAAVVVILMGIVGVSKFRKNQTMKSLERWEKFADKKDPVKLADFAKNEGKGLAAFYAYATASQEHELKADWVAALSTAEETLKVAPTADLKGFTQLRICGLQEASNQEAVGCYQNLANDGKQSRVVRLQALSAQVRLKIKNQDKTGAQSLIEEMTKLDANSETVRWAKLYVQAQR